MQIEAQIQRKNCNAQSSFVRGDQRTYLRNVRLLVKLQECLEFQHALLCEKKPASGLYLLHIKISDKISAYFPKIRFTERKEVIGVLHFTILVYFFPHIR